MKPLFNISNIENAPNKIPFECEFCKEVFFVKKEYIKYSIKNKLNRNSYCSRKCRDKARVTKVTVICKFCGIQFQKLPKEIKKSNNHFCSHSCSAKYSNSKRITTKGTKKLICSKCKKEFTTNKHSSNNICNECKRCKILPNKGRIYYINCIICNKEIYGISPNKKYCDSCRFKIRSSNGKRWGKKVGRAAGIKSAKSQKRRSKNEIYFAELCVKHFKNVTTNDPIFTSDRGNWDADVIIHDHKIAVLWNGVWHYKKITKAHSLKQVQARDKIKLDVIAKNGFTAHIIKDMGAFNRKFVEEQFLLLLKKIEKGHED